MNAACTVAAAITRQLPDPAAMTSGRRRAGASGADGTGERTGSAAAALMESLPADVYIGYSVGVVTYLRSAGVRQARTPVRVVRGTTVQPACSGGGVGRAGC